jgi:hypothetical protein
MYVCNITVFETLRFYSLKLIHVWKLLSKILTHNYKILHSLTIEISYETPDTVIPG